MELISRCKTEYGVKLSKLLDKVWGAALRVVSPLWGRSLNRASELCAECVIHAGCG